MIPPGGTKVLYYALGGGAGHLVRGLAILRQLRRLGIGDSAIIADPRFSSFADAESVPIVPVECRSSCGNGEKVLEAIDNAEPAVLAVDTFPSGVLGELAPLLSSLLPAKKVFVARKSRKPYTDLSAYDLVVDAENTGLVHKNLLATERILIRDLSELKSRGEARWLLRCPPEATLVFCLHAGFRGEAEKLFRLVAKVVRMANQPDLVLRLLATPCDLPLDLQQISLSHFPAVELLPAADIVIAAAGYNTFHEVEALGLPSIFIPLARPVDDQFGRAGSHSLIAHSPKELLDHLRTLSASTPKPSRPEATRANGAVQAAEAIYHLLA